MSPRRLAVLLALCLSMSACNSTSVIENVSAPSRETTSSIVPSAPVPSAPVAASVAAEANAAPLALVDEERPVVQAAAYPRVQVHARKFSDAHPISFGKSQPQDLVVHGVDVSRWQGEIDWVKLRSQGANFAFIKATDGGDHLDPMFHKNWKAAAEAGIKRGAYHFFYWCRVASHQADWFIRNVPKEKGALPPVLDVEWNAFSNCKKRPSREVVLEKMQVFLTMLEKHYGQKPIIYTAPDFYRDNLKGAFTDYPFWLRAVAQHPEKVYPGRDWVFWQYSGTGLSKGVKGKIDLNVFHGSEREWHAWLAKATR